MLTGTLVTVAGFIPIGLNSSLAGEYTFSLFVVIALALLLSWVVAVLFAPLIGVVLLPRKVKRNTGEKGHGAKIFAAMLLAAKRWRWVTITVCLGLLVASIVGLGHVEQQFFPSSDRPELLVDMTLPQNSAIAETKARWTASRPYWPRIRMSPAGAPMSARAQSASRVLTEDRPENGGFFSEGVEVVVEIMMGLLEIEWAILGGQKGGSMLESTLRRRYSSSFRPYARR